MQITEISIQKNNPKRYNIFIDGIYKLSAELEDIVRYSLKEGMQLDNEKLEMLVEKCEYTKAFNHSLRIMGMRDYSIGEMTDKLQKIGYSSNVIEKILSKLIELGFLNDERYHDKFVKDSIYLKKHGIKRIEYELKKKGISQNDADLESEYSEAIYQNALALAQKKFNQMQGKNDIKNKIYRYLAGKGYDYEMIRKILNKVCKIEEDFSDFD